MDKKYLSSKDGEGLQVQIFITIMLYISVFAHIILCVYFLLVRDFGYFAAASSGIVLFSTALFLNKAGKIRAACFMFVFIILFNSFFTVYLFGAELGSRWMVIIALLPTVLYFNFSKTQKICIVAAAPIIINLHLILPEYNFPPFRLESLNFLRFYYANMIIFSIVFILIANQAISMKLNELRARDAEKFKALSITDELTKLNNRRSFLEYMNLMWKQSRRVNLPVSIIMIDVDWFKNYNDTLGHLEGDKALIAIAQCLKNQLKRETDLVARYGGEEFVCLLPFTEKDDVLIVAQRLIQSVEDMQIPHPMNSQSKYITISAGVASTTPDENNSSLQLLAEADKALYHAKKTGRNRFAVNLK